MTKRHFEWAAAYVRDISKDVDTAEDKHRILGITSAFCALFGEFNPRFDFEHFRAACRGEDFFDGRITRRYSKAS